MIKKYKRATYLFTVGMRNGRTSATFTVLGLAGENNVEVLGENRTILSKNGVFKDRYNAWDVHLYRVKQSNSD
jgi:hypothetical protein